MSIFSKSDWGRLLLRVAIGGLMIFHGVAKIRGGIGWLEGALDSSGLPSVMAYGVYVGEVVAPLLILLGVATVPAAAVVAFNMLVAIWVAHRDELFALTEHGGWSIELPMLFLMGSVAIVLLGPGEIVIQRARR